MAHIEGTPRNQYLLLPPLVEDWIPENHPSRIIDMFVESIDTESIEITENNEFTGRPSYDPKVMLKIMLYGYSRGERSSRILERRTYEDLAYIWLTGNLHPDYRTIARFRQNNIKTLKSLLKETLRLYKDIGIGFDGTIFSDGSKIYANASDKNVVTPERVEKIAEAILKGAERVDCEEDQRMGDENKNFFNKEKLEEIKENMKKCQEALEGSKAKVSLTDKDAKFMPHSGGHGKHLSYNAQLSVDQYGIIMEVDVVDKPSDDGELLRERVEGVEENVREEVKKVVADSAFFETNAVKELMEEGREVVVPSPVEVKRERGKRKYFGIKDFRYDNEKDEYICPFDKRLKFRKEGKNRGKEYLVYEAKKEDCEGCPLRASCCRSGERSNN